MYTGNTYLLMNGQTGERIGEKVYRCEFKGVSDCVRLSHEIAGDHPVVLIHEDLGHAIFACGDWSRAHPAYAATALCQDLRRRD